jgi:hypothetical protein
MDEQPREYTIEEIIAILGYNPFYPSVTASDGTVFQEFDENGNFDEATTFAKANAYEEKLNGGA